MTEPERVSVPSPDGEGTVSSVPRLPVGRTGAIRPAISVTGLPLAEAWERFVAYIIDALILSAINMIPLGAMVIVVWDRVHNTLISMNVANHRPIGSGRDTEIFPSLRHLLAFELIGLAIFIPFALAVSYLYMVTLMHRDGQTIGKRITKIQVVRVDGQPITRPIARRRWVVSHVAAMIAPYFSYADDLWLLWDKPYRQCLHDKCAETVVVKIKP